MKTKTECLAEALNGEVVEDSGYRGIIRLRETGEHLRYHVSSGVQVVQRMGQLWETTKLIMAPEDVTEFLVSVGVAPVRTGFKPLEDLAALLQGELEEKFNAGGGVIKLKREDGTYHVRYSPVTGVDLVSRSLSKWRLVERLFTKRDLVKLLMEPNLTLPGKTWKEDWVLIHKILTKEGGEGDDGRNRGVHTN